MLSLDVLISAAPNVRTSTPPLYGVSTIVVSCVVIPEWVTVFGTSPKRIVVSKSTQLVGATVADFQIHLCADGLPVITSKLTSAAAI